MAPNTILRRREVERSTGLPCSTLYRLIAAKQFPAPIQLGPNSVGWLESEVGGWLEVRIAERDRRLGADGAGTPR